MDGIGVDGIGVDGIGVVDGTGAAKGIDGTVGAGFTSFATTAAAESAIVAVINKGETFFKNVIIFSESNRGLI